MQKVRFNDVMHYIYEEPSLRSYASYVMLKNVYRLQEAAEKHGGRLKQLFFNQEFLLSEEKRLNGKLSCAYCDRDDLKVYRLFSFDTRIRAMTATADHFWPKGKGGPAFNVDNLVIACRPCNERKAATIYDVKSLVRQAGRDKVSSINFIL